MKVCPAHWNCYWNLDCCGNRGEKFETLIRKGPHYVPNIKKDCLIEGLALKYLSCIGENNIACYQTLKKDSKNLG